MSRVSQPQLAQAMPRHGKDSQNTQAYNVRSNKGCDADGNEKPQWVNVYLSRCITVKSAMKMFAANSSNKEVNRCFNVWMKKNAFSVSAGFHWYSREDRIARPDRRDRFHFTIVIDRQSFHVYVALESLRGQWQWRDVKITGVSGPGFHSKRARLDEKRFEK